MTISEPRLIALREAGILNALDLHLATALGEMGGEESPDVLLAVALASHGVRHGQVCVRLRNPEERPVPPVERGGAEPLTIEWPDPDDWIQQLQSSSLVGRDDAERPLVLNDSGSLYLSRYHAHELELQTALEARIRTPRREVDASRLRSSLDRLFGVSSPESPIDWQKVAALTAAIRSLSIITGGPGTGKTTTVVRLLAVLQELQLQGKDAEVGGAPLRVLLLAPTGKAAARLAESIRDRRDELDVSDAVRASLDGTVSTIHRALGIRPGRRAARFDAKNPLPADVVVVDESSMVDLSLMTRLVDAVPHQARLVLLGDRDQLASVEAGAILGDLCNGGRALPPWSETARRDLIDITGIDPQSAADPSPGTPGTPEFVPGIRDCIVELTHSHRFASGGGIATLAGAVRTGDSERAWSILAGSATQSDANPSSEGTLPELAFRELGRREDPATLAQTLLGDSLDRFASVPTDNPNAILKALGRFRVLCAHRNGPLGSNAFNRALQQRFGQEPVGRSPVPSEVDVPWFSRRPVMITTNDYQLDLYNGDVGVALPARPEATVDAQRPGHEGRFRVYFPATAHPDGAGPTHRSFHSARIPQHETVYAMTVHKSQGSEFDEVLLVLPTHASPILTRELIYTGITRARHRLVLAATRDVLRTGLSKRIRRASGLREALWGRTSPPKPTRKQRLLF